MFAPFSEGSLLSFLAGKQQRNERRRPSRSSVKLEVEALESRVVPTLTVNIINNTGLADSAVSVVMAGGLQHYDGNAWVGNPSGGFVTSTPFSAFAGLANHKATVVVPDGLDGGFIDFFLGTDVRLVSGANQRVGSPSPYDLQPGKPGVGYPQFQEAEFSTNGAGNTKFAIDISNVDQWSMPVQLSLQSSSTVFGTQLIQSSFFAKFDAGLTGDFRNIIIKDGNNFKFIANPRKYLDAGPGGPGSPLNQYFDAALKTLFETGSNNIDLTVSGAVWTGSREPDPNRPGAFRLKYVNGGTTIYVYEPGMNGIANPTWNEQGASSGKQVFGGDGVFNDAGRQQPGSANVGALNDIEQQLNAALNRGVSHLDSSQWLVAANHYQTGTFNQYAKVLHANFIGGKAYGFSEDEQGFESKFDFLPMPDTATFTLGALNAAAPRPRLSPRQAILQLLRRALADLQQGRPVNLDKLFTDISRVLRVPNLAAKPANRRLIDHIFSNSGRTLTLPKLPAKPSLLSIKLP